jgi:phytoene dehydrogenase-like protein
MTNSDQIVIIGGGHNGLVCAAYLARAGNKVLVLEAADQVGGAAATREFAPGYKASCAHLLNLLDKKVSSELGLRSQGLRMAKKGIETLALSEDGNHLTIGPRQVKGEGISVQDKEAYTEYHRFMSKFAGIIGKLHNQVPPRITYDRGDLFALGKLGLNIRMLGRDDMREFLRITGINIYDVLKENFDNPLLKGALSLDAVLGTNSGPRSNNSVFTALHRMSGNTGHTTGTNSIPAGAMGAVTDAIAAAATKAGAEIRTSSPVSRILMENDAVSGVELANGEQLPASIVISNADPKRTILDLLGARHVEAGFARKINNIRAKGNAAKLHLALDGLPEFNGVSQAQLGQRMLIAPTVEYVEKAFNHSKYGEFSVQPVMEITIPSIHDNSLAPSGKHVLSAIVQYAPRQLGEGWESGKAAFTEQILELLSTYAPGIREKIVATELLTPEDIENEFRMTGGHWHHGELALDQFLMVRPVPRSAQYKTPVDGLYLCGAGCHPGGGVMGSAGKNAASVVLANLKESGQQG